MLLILFRAMTTGDMKSLLRFLVFVLIAAAAVGSVYIWKHTRPDGLAEAPRQLTATTLAPLDARSRVHRSGQPGFAFSCEH